MGNRKYFSEGFFVVGFLLVLLFLVGCTPSGETVVVTRGTPTVESASESYCAGGVEVITPEDVGCYLDSIDSTQLQWVEGETADSRTALLFASADEIDSWAGAAILYTPATNSMLVMDSFGDVMPQASVFRSRPGLAILEVFSWNEELMAGIKRQVQERWQTTPQNEPEIRLSAAWQDGRTTIFLVSIAGLATDDARFYCPSQGWIIGEIEVHIEAECVFYEPGTLVSQFFFQAQEIEGAEIREVQLSLDGEASNVIMVGEGKMSDETAVYQAVLNQWGRRSLVIKGETSSGINEDATPADNRIDSELWQSYVSVNESPNSLRFLFQNSDTYIIQPGVVIEQYYLPPGTLQAGCVYFREEFPGLSGIVSFSRIGLSEDGLTALVHSTLECGTADIEAVYYVLEKTEEGWQVVGNFPAEVDLPTLTPELAYDGDIGGCGDIFMYRSNDGRSEYIWVYVDARVFDFSTGSMTLDIAANPDSVNVYIDVYSDNIDKLGYFPYCNDVAPVAKPQSVWRAVNGFVMVNSAIENPITVTCRQSYEASISLEDVTFKLGEETVNLPSLSIDDVEVGWCAG